MYTPEGDSEDEEGYSEEEGCTENGPISLQNGIGGCNSMYSRIYDDVRLQIPSVDFQSFESDDEQVVESNSQMSNETLHFKSDAKSCTASSSASAGAVASEYKEMSNAGTSTSTEIAASSNTTGSTQTPSATELSATSLPSTQQSIGTSAHGQQSFSQLKVSRETGVMSLSLEANFALDSLEKALKNFDNIPEASEVTESSPSVVEANKLKMKKKGDEADADLVSKLSSFSLNEKNSASKVDKLLDMISSHSLQKESEGTDELVVAQFSGVEDKKNRNLKTIAKDDKVQFLFSSEQQEDDMIENETIYLDLRNEIQDVITKNSEGNIPIKVIEDESSSSSEDEDWNERRKVFKSGLNNSASKNVNMWEGQSAGFLKKDNQNSSSKLYSKTDSREGDYKDKKPVNDQSAFLKQSHHVIDKPDNEGGCFNIEPLADKIRSWHRPHQANITQCNTNAKHINNLLSDEQFESETVHSHYTSDVERELDAGNVDNAQGIKEDCLLQNQIDVCSGVHLHTDKATAATENTFSENNKKMKGTFPTKNSSLLQLESFYSDKNNKVANTRPPLLQSSAISIKPSSSKEFVNHEMEVPLEMKECLSAKSFSVNGEMAEHVLIADNLLLIKADISVGEQSTTNAQRHSLHETWSEKSVELLSKNSNVDIALNPESLRRMESKDPEKCLFVDEVENGFFSEKSSTGSIQDFENETSINFGSSERPSLESEKDISGSLNSRKFAKHFMNKETEMSSKEIELTTFASKNTEKKEATPTNGGKPYEDQETKLKGLLEQLKTDPQNKSVNDDVLQAKAINTNSKDFCLTTGEETPLVLNERKSRTSIEINKYPTRRTKTTLSKEDIDKNDNLIIKNNDSSTKPSFSDRVASADCSTSSKNKKKSKKRTNRGNEESLHSNNKKSNEHKMNIDTESNLSKKSNSIDTEDVKQKPKISSLKESERLKIREQILLLQRENGTANIIFDEEHSFSQPFGSLPQSSKESGKLLLQVCLQSPGVCSKSCAKNTLTLKERSDSYIGICTFFLSILHGSNFNIYEFLNVPFSVIAFEQAYVDSQLHLFIGVIENEISGQSTQNLKRGKQLKGRKTFHQTVTQYLNKTDLENILSSLMAFDIGDSNGPLRTVTCPGARKLSSFVTVSQDEAAVDRIFGLKASLLWNKITLPNEPLSQRVAWIPEQDKKNESTVVLIDNLTSLLPRTICEFMKMTREASLDISGQRIAYVSNKAGKETVFLVVALRGPSVTTVQVGKAFTSDSPGLLSIKSNYMRADFTSILETPKNVTVTGPAGIRDFSATIRDPLLTYTIGRRRGECEVVRWFGRRITQLSDVNLSVAAESKTTTGNKLKLSEKSDVFSKDMPASSLLSVCSDRVVLSISSLVPSVFISAALTVAESRGLYALCIGKVRLCEDDLLTVGLKATTVDYDITAEKQKKKLDKSEYPVSLILFQGENCAHRSVGVLAELFKQLSAKLPRDALSKETLQQKGNGLIKYERVKKERSIDDFFAFCPINRKIAQILDHMTLPQFSHLDNEIMNTLPPFRVDTSESPRICVAIFVGQPMVEMIPYALNAIFRHCIEDPLCMNPQSSIQNAFVYQERPAAEIIGIKHFSSLPKHMAHVCNRYSIGAGLWLDSVSHLEDGPVVVVVVRWVRMAVTIEQHCEAIKNTVAKKLYANELTSRRDSFYDAYSFDDLDTVLRIMLTMFNINELLPDSCSSWFKHTQWPIYLPRSSKFNQDLDHLLGLFSNSNDHATFNETKKQSNHESFRIVSPLSISLPASLILRTQRSLSFIKIHVDWNFPKYIARVLGILTRDNFKIVGLNFPGGISPKFDSLPKMHIAVSRANAVYRLNQWIPELTLELHNKHTLEVSPTARRAYEEINWHFQRSETGGIFEDSPLSIAEKLKFQEDDIYASKDFRRIEWGQQLAEKTKPPGLKQENRKLSFKKGEKRVEIDDCFIMPEVNVIIMTNVLLRGKFLGERLSENVRYLGLWEKLSSLGFKTIGARITELTEEHAEFLLTKFEMSQRQQRSFVKRLSNSNGPIFVLALLRDFALSNFWNVLSRAMTEKELRLVEENVLVPSNRNQVEILLGSLFETVVPNSEVEIKKVG